MKIKFAWLLLLAKISMSQVSQNLDSLKWVYHKNPKNLENINLLAQSFETSNVDSAGYYAKKLLSLAKKNNNYSACAYNTLANCALVKNELDKAIKYYNIAIDFAKKGKLTFSGAVYTSSLAQVYLNKGEFKSAIRKYNEALTKFHKEKDKARSRFYLAAIYGGLGDSYNFIGLHDIALENLFESLRINKKINDPISIAINYNSIASVYNNLNQIEKSKKYNLLALRKFRTVDYPLGEATVLFNLAENYLKLNQIKASLKNLEEAKSIILALKTEYNLGNVYQLFGEVYSREGKHKEGIKYFEKALEIHKKSGASMYYGHALVGLGTCFFKLNENRLANEKFLEALKIFEKENLQKDKKVTLEKLISLSIKDEPKSVLENYFELYKKAEVAYLNEESQKSIVAQEIKYETEIKESKIRIQKLQIQKEKTNKYIAYGGIGVLILLSGGGYFWFRNKQGKKELLNQNALMSLQQNLHEMELSNLNKQLDPHEISNLIANISPEIQDKAPESYRNMLKLFNITRASLNNSITESVENQLKQVDDFLSLEKSMLAVPLDYSIQNTIECTDVLIPRLLLKNLVENAVKHGIKGKKDGGKINVKLRTFEDFIFIEVDDTGKGRKNTSSQDTGIGTSTYRKLFDILNRKNKEKASFDIFDKEQGTTVQVKIPLNYKYN